MMASVITNQINKKFTEATLLSSRFFDSYGLANNSDARNGHFTFQKIIIILGGARSYRCDSLLPL